VTGEFDPPRALAPADGEVARALIGAVIGATAYAARAHEVLDEAFGGDPQWRTLGTRRVDRFEALAVFGPVAGANGAWRMPVLIFSSPVVQRAIADPLIDAMVQIARREGARMLIAELPADAVIGISLTALRANGFRQEGKIPDYYRDGVALLFLRREM
jgi:hypothetical protein